MSGPVETELEWFFTMAESDMGARSNFAATVGQAVEDSPESQAEAAHAHRVVQGWLRTIGDLHTGVLAAAFRARPWPRPLREAVGRFTGVVVRLGSAERELPDDLVERDLIDLCTATRLDDALARGDRAALEGLVLRGRVLFRAAVVAYEQVRGGAACPVLPGVSS